MMNLETLKNNWESLAERDALFAILTDHRRMGGKWTGDEFMATGKAEIETVMHHLSSIRRIPDYAGKALDFGCGVGRVAGVEVDPRARDARRDGVARGRRQHEVCPSTRADRRRANPSMKPREGWRRGDSHPRPKM